MARTPVGGLPVSRPPEAKVCATCGRTIEWRRKWADDWDRVRYCGARCRRQRPGPLDRQLEEAIVDLLAERAGSATICPSEAARRVGGDDGWRPLMERARSAARRLVAEDRVVIRQRGRTVDPSTAKGPIRLARGARW